MAFETVRPEAGLPSADGPLTDQTLQPQNGFTGGATHDVDSCPSRIAIGKIADKWKIVILILLSRSGVRRFKELQRDLGSVSQKVLTSALRELEADGLVQRKVYPEIPPRVEYRITERSHELMPILFQLNEWAERWYPPAKADDGAA